MEKLLWLLLGFRVLRYVAPVAVGMCAGVAALVFCSRAGSNLPTLPTVAACLVVAAAVTHGIRETMAQNRDRRGPRSGRHTSRDRSNRR